MIRYLLSERFKLMIQIGLLQAAWVRCENGSMPMLNTLEMFEMDCQRPQREDIL